MESVFGTGLYLVNAPGSNQSSQPPSFQCLRLNSGCLGTWILSSQSPLNCCFCCLFPFDLLVPWAWTLKESGVIRSCLAYNCCYGCWLYRVFDSGLTLGRLGPTWCVGCFTGFGSVALWWVYLVDLLTTTLVAYFWLIEKALKLFYLLINLKFCLCFCELNCCFALVSWRITCFESLKSLAYDLIRLYASGSRYTRDCNWALCRCAFGLYYWATWHSLIAHRSSTKLRPSWLLPADLGLFLERWAATEQLLS